MTCFRLNGKPVRRILKEYGLCYETFFRCMEDGMSVKDALVYTVHSNGKAHKPVHYLGDTPLCKIFKTNGSKYNTILKCIRDGSSVEDAVRRYGVRKCLHCGKVLPETTRKRYCCKECKYMASTQEVECSWCGKKFRVVHQQAKKRRKYGIFCCQECFNKARVYLNHSKKRDFNYKVKAGRKQDIKL